MKLDKKEAELIDRAIQHWQQEGIVDELTGNKMRKSYDLDDDNSNVISTYALVASVSCGLLAFGALVMDEKWIELIRRKFGFSEIVVGMCFFLLSAVFVYFSSRRKRNRPDAPSSNEAFNITIVLSLAVAVAYIGRSIGYQDGNYAPIILLASMLYGAAGFFLRSRLLWAAMLVGLAGWWGAQTYYWSKGADYFFNMNYALRMTVFGVAVLGLQFITEQLKRLAVFAKITQVLGWVFFLVAAWSLSVMGNSSSFDVWWQVRQGKLWYWALAFTLLLIVLVLYAFRKKDPFLRDITLVFFLVNIYTRYFEYFWDKTNRGLFFAILAFSFWWIGKAAERWRKKQMIYDPK